MKEKVIKVLSSIYDPEIPLNIWDLGLIYRLDINDQNDVSILMTMTSPNCPIADIMPVEVKKKLSALHGIGKIDIQVTFDPPWDMDKLSDAAKLELGLY